MAGSYDVNFQFPVHTLESDRVRLVPFHPELHGEAFHNAAAPYSEIWDWVPFGPFATVADFLNWTENRIRRDPTHTLFAVYNKPLSHPDETRYELAGLIGLLNTSPSNLSTEIGFVFTLPPFQRTHVTTHAVGLLLGWCFDEIGLRRVQWQANELNERSWRAAEKMGFTKEAVVRWQRALPPGKSHGVVQPREGDPKPDWGGRHSALLAVCWDDWEGGVKAKVQERMARR